MKRLLTIFALLSAVVMSSCEKYDDTELRQKINGLEERISAIEALLKASANNLTIVGITETEESITITFSNNSTITIDQIKNESSPITGVDVDGDLVYITLDDGTVLTFKKYVVDETYKIYYTTINDKKINWDGTNTYTNVYENGQGVLTFYHPVTSVVYQGGDVLESIVLPATTETVGSFYNMTNLREIYCKALTPPATPPAIEMPDGMKTNYRYFLDKYDSGYYPPYVPIGCTIYVPMESVAAYRKAAGWSHYSNYIKGYNFE